MGSTFEETVDRLFYSDPEKCIRKALCKVKWRGKEVGYGCLVKDPDVKHPELSKYFIITTNQVISEDKFASSGYHYQVVFEEKSGSKKEAFSLWDIIKSSAFGLHTPGASVSDEDRNENDQISQGDGNDDLYKPKEPVFFGSTLVAILIDSKSPKLCGIGGRKCSVLKNLPRMASVNHREQLRYYNGNKICTYSIRSGDSSRESVSKHGTVLFQSGLSVVGILHSSSCNNDQQVISPIWLKSSLLEMMEDEKKKKEEQRRRDEEENTRKEEERNKKELEQMPMEVEEERKTKQEEEGEAEERKSEMKCAEDEKKKKEEQKKREEEENMRKEEERNKKELEQMPMEVEEERKTKQEEEDEEEEKKSEIKHAETSIPLHGDNRRPLLPPDYNALQRVLQEASQAGYDDLHFKAEQLKSQIPPLFMKEKGNFSPNIRRDENSQKLLPASKLKGEYVALHTTGDGNCLFRAASILAYGNEDKHQEMRVRIVVELLCNRSYYLNVPYIEERIRAQELFIQGKSIHKGRGNGPGELNKPVLEVAFEEEVRETCKDATWASDWHLQALATILQHPLKIVFAEGIGALERYFDDNIHPLVGYSKLDPLVILWTSTGPLETTGLNHFVPLVPADEVHSLGKNKSGSASTTDVTDSKEDQNAERNNNAKQSRNKQPSEQDEKGERRTKTQCEPINQLQSKERRPSLPLTSFREAKGTFSHLFSGEIQIPRQNVNQPSPRPSAVTNLDDTSSSPEQQSHTCNGYKSLKDLNDRLENEGNKLKDSYGSRLTDSREIQSTCKSCQNQQRIQEENRALREQLQLMKGNLDKTKEERDSLQMVVLLLSKELYNFRPDSKEAFKESPSVDPKVSDTKWSDTKADTKQNNGSSKSQSSKTTKNHQSKSSKKKPRNKSSQNSSNTLNHNQERSSPTTVIIGDSIIRNIQGYATDPYENKPILFLFVYFNAITSICVLFYFLRLIFYSYFT